MMVYTTKRLILRQWQEEDIPAFAKINQDPKVIKFLGKALTIDQIRDFILNKINAHFKKHGFGLWAIVLQNTEELVGMVGLRRINFDLPFCPAVR
jgi:RimJ/RimL family protein N-acetyltransferase